MLNPTAYTFETFYLEIQKNLTGNNCHHVSQLSVRAKRYTSL